MVRRRKKKKRKLRTSIKIAVLAILVLVLFFSWQRPPRERLPESHIAGIRERLSSGSTYSLFRSASDFLHSYPDHEEIYWAHFALGVCESRKNDHAAAVDSFRKAQRYDHMPVELKFRIHTFLSLEYIKQGMYSEALRETEQACEGTRNIDELAYLYYQKAYLLNRVKRFNDALESLVQGRRFNPDSSLWVAMQLEEGYARQNLKDFKLATLVYKEILEKFPEMEIECTAARKSLATIEKVKKMESSNELKERELQLLLQEERRFYY